MPLLLRIAGIDQEEAELPALLHRLDHRFQLVAVPLELAFLEAEREQGTGVTSGDARGDQVVGSLQKP
jgi:hypothetical protein